MKLDKLEPGFRYKPYPHSLAPGMQTEKIPEGAVVPAVALPAPPVLSDGMTPGDSKALAEYLKKLPGTVVKEALKIVGDL